MPIIGITDQLGTGFDRIAKLHKGAPKETRSKNGKEYEVVGKDLEYFRIEFQPEFEYLRELWEELYGETPDEFENVFVTANTTVEAFQAWKEEWNASATLLHRCDGENQVLRYDAAIGMHIKAKTACETKLEKKCGCEEVGRLDLVFPEFCQLSGVLGVITLTTHSVFDIMTLHGRLQQLETINRGLRGIPLIIGRSKRQVSAPEIKNGQRTGKRMKVTKSLLYVRSAAEFTQTRLIPALAGAIEPPQEKALLPTGTDDVVTPISLGNGGSRRIDTSEPELTIVTTEVPVIAESATTELATDETEGVLPIANVPVAILNKAYDMVKQTMDRPTFDGVVVMFDDVKPGATAQFIAKRVIDTRKAQQAASQPADGEG